MVKFLLNKKRFSVIQEPVDVKYYSVFEKLTKLYHQRHYTFQPRLRKDS